MTQEKPSLEFIAEFIRKQISTKPIKVKRTFQIYNKNKGAYESKTITEYIFINVFNVKKFSVREENEKIILTINFNIGYLVIKFDKEKVFDLEGEIENEF
jgi:hypothetical protein